MEEGKILSVNSFARVEHLAVEAKDLSEGFEKLEKHLKQHGLGWPQILASAFENGEARMMVTSDSEFLDTLLRTLSNSKGLRPLRAMMSSVTLTCFGAVATDLPHRAMQILKAQNIRPEKYILSPHSVSLFVQPAQREAAIRALHTLV